MVAFFGLNMFDNDEYSEKSIQSPIDVMKHVDTAVIVLTFFRQRRELKECNQPK